MQVMNDPRRSPFDPLAPHGGAPSLPGIAVHVTVEPRLSPWHAFHRAWTAAVGTPGYNKAVWGAAEEQLLKAGYGPRTPWGPEGAKP
jgi:hypothetical protein